MASSPAFASTPRAAVVNASTANTARDGSGTIVDILTGAAAGTRIERLVVTAESDPADSIVTIFLHNGTSYFLFDEFDWGNPAAASPTASSVRMERAYRDLVLPSASWKIACAVTVVPAGKVVVHAFGADLT